MKTNIISGLVLTLLVFRASAQNYSIDWFTIDGGGGTSSGGSYTLIHDRKASADRASLTRLAAGSCDSIHAISAPF